MDNDFDPVVGNWYTQVEDDRTFIVLAVDEENGVIEVRYDDGEVEELDLGGWADLDLELTEAPDGVEAEADDAAEGIPLEEPDVGWKAAGVGNRRRPGTSWEDDDEDEEDDDEDEDWGEESDDY